METQLALADTQLRILEPFWSHQLSGLEPLDLPSDHPRPATPSQRRDVLAFQIGPELLGRLQDLCRGEQASLQMGLLALVGLLLHRYSRQDDLAIGIPSGGGTHTLPIRMNFEPGLSFRQLLRSVRETMIGAYAYQELPFEPMLQVRLELVELHEPRSIQREATSFDLCFELRRGADRGLLGSITYASDLFSADRIERLSSHLLTLLGSALAEPDAAVNGLNLLPEAERQLMERWQQGPSLEVPDLCVHELFEQQVARTPEAIALVFEGQEISYSDLNARANQLAHRLIACGVAPESMVALAFERSIDMVVGLLAILKAGGATVPLDPAYPEERLAFMLADSAPVALLLHGPTRERLKALAGAVPMVDLEADAAAWEELSVTNPDPAALGLEPHHLAYVIYTSGSTGRPKGVMNEHRGIVNRLLWMQAAYGLGQHDAVLQKTPYGFDVSVWEFLWPLLSGARLVIARPEGHKDAHYLADVIRQTEITTLHFVPPMLQVFLDHPSTRDCASLRRVFCSGDALPATLVDRFHAWLPGRELHNLYGPTEAAVEVTAWDCAQPIPAPGLTPIGRPIANTRIYVLDPEGLQVPVGVTGELFIAGIQVARGYLNLSQLTAERFLPDPYSREPGARMYRTGDLARWLPDGNLEFLGRADFQVKIRGFRIELGEIEAALRACEGIREAVVLAREDGLTEKRLVAYATADRGAGSAEAGALPAVLKAQLLGSLPEYMVPAAFVVLDSLPLTPNGKLDRRALPAPEADAYVTSVYVAPEGPVEEALAELWRELLGIPRVGRLDDFFALGGHSLRAMQVMSRLRTTLGLEVPLAELFARPVLAEFAAGLADAGTAESGPIPPADRSQPLPLTSAQRRLWFLAQLEGPSATYNIPLAWRLLGELDAAALRAALDQLVARHEALRTTFVAVDGVPMQRIEPATDARFALIEHDLRVTADGEVELVRWLEKEAAEPFDLEAGPLLRGRLLRLADREHALLLTLHHAIADGWSLAVLGRELGTLYGAMRQGEADPLPPLPIQYPDYAVWERQWLEGALLQQQAAYWQNALAGAPVLLELPTDRPRPPLQDYVGAMVPVRLDAELTRKLKALARRHGATLFQVLLAGFAALLSRLSGQAEVVIGSPSAHRSRTELEGLIGFFVNTLALRIDTAAASVAELIARAKGQTLAAQAHGDLPFEQVVELLQPPRSLAHSPLFQAMFAWQITPEAPLGLPDLTVEALTPPCGTTKFDLTLSLAETDQRIGGSLEFATALFDPATLDRWLGHWRTLLTAMVEAPDATAVGRLPLLSEVERHLMLEEWNGIETNSPLDRCIHQLVEEQAERTPGALALVFEDQSLTYAELNTRATRLAHHLITLGVQPDDRVAIGVERSLEMVVGLLAILKAGGATVPLDPAYPEERLAFMLADSAPVALLVHGATRERMAALPGAVPMVDLETDASAWAELSTTSPDSTALGLSPNNLAYVIFTSGSTGRPKGVAMPHRALLNLVSWQLAQPGFDPSARTLQFSPIGFDVSFQEIFTTLSAGGALILIREESRRDSEEILRVLKVEQVERLFLPFVALQALATASQGQWPPSLREVVTAGEQLRITAALQACFENSPCRLHNHYGPSETHVATAFRLPDDVNLWSLLPPIGRPIANTRIYVLDAGGQPAPIGVAGEIHIGGAGVARGYLNRPELTAERFLPDPFGRNPEARIYRTGDLARWLPDGNLEFLDRADFQVKVRGFRIEPGEIESALRGCEGIREAVVLAREDKPGEKLLVAYVTAAGTPDNSTLPGMLKAHLQRSLPDYMVPAGFVVMESLPLTANGKLDRKALPPLSFSGDALLCVEPSTELERQLHTLWSEVLGHDDFGIHDDFFAVGGHSLAAARLVTQLHQLLGLQLKVATLFAQPTISGLLAALANQRAKELSPAISRTEPLDLDGREAWPASFSQSRLWFLQQLDPQHTAAGIHSLWELHGELDVEVLGQAFRALLERQAALRCGFRLAEGTVFQVLQPSGCFELGHRKLARPSAQESPPTRGAANTEQEFEQALDYLVLQEISKPFDLHQGPLLRSLLVELGPTEHRLLITVHPIVSEGWSQGLLMDELAALYQAVLSPSPHGSTLAQASLPPLSSRYADFSDRQRQQLSSGRREQLLGYLQRQLADLEPLELPTDKPRPALPSYRGASLVFDLDAARSGGLERLCQEQDVPLETGLLALVAVLLQRYSRSDDIPIGMPHWDREHPDLEGLVGFFVNLLVVRCDLSEGPSFQEVLQRIRGSSLEAYAHQDLPFEELVEVLQPERDSSRHPLVQVMVQLLDLSKSSLSLTGLTVQPLRLRTDTVRFDLEFFFLRQQQGLRVSIAYSTDLFDGGRMDRLQGHLTTLLDGVLADPARSIDELSILTAPESEQLAGWSKGPSLAGPDVCVHELFVQQVERTPTAIALVAEGQEISYSDLNARATQLAQQLRELGVGPGEIVALALERSVELIVALLAILKAGGAYLPLDPAWPVARRQLLLEEAGCSLLLGAAGPEVIHNREPDKGTVSGSSLAYITYTSGSTGLPKGVCVGHRAIVRLVHAVNGYQLSAGARVLQLAPVAFDAATFEIWGPLLNGGTLVVAPPGQLSLADLAEVLRRERITTLWLTAGLFQAMVESQLDALAGVRQVLAGGDVLSPEPVQRLLAAFPAGHEFINGYGPTENTTFTCCHRLAAGETLGSGGVPLGRPIAATDVRVVDRAGLPCPIGIPGELWIGGAGLAVGYLNKPELTAERFITDPLAADPTARLYRSGDLVSWNADGTLAFHGRLDGQIKLRGFRIEPGEIEAQLQTHGAVAQAVVVVRKDDPANPRLIAYWVARGEDSSGAPDATATTSQELLAFLAERLPQHMVPAAIVELQALPLTTNGKLDRRALPAPSFAGDVQQRGKPRTDLERQLHAIWAEVLGHSAFGIHDNFFLIGGHSLAVARLVSRLEQTISGTLSFIDLFQHPSIAQLAPHLTLANTAAAEAAAIPPAASIPGPWEPANQAFPASFAQSRLWFLHQLHPELTAYHLPLLWRLRGELQVQSLNLALGELIERHPSLRTSFRLEGSEVLQIIHPPAPFCLEAEPLGDRDSEAVIEQWLAQEHATPFDLRSGLLIRARLLAVDRHEHLLLINHHHIASDGWSCSLLARELAELYNAHQHGRSADLQPLAVHYHDYAAWQRQRLSGEHLQQLKDYWIPQLTDLEPLEIPSDHPRPATPSHQGASVSFQITPELLAPFEQLCRLEGATLQMGLLALVALLLHRYSRQDDLAIGVPIWGRNHPDLEKLIGFFINTLPIRTRLAPQQSFRQLLQQVKATSLAAYDQQELPFEQIVEALNLPRDTSRNPLVQVMLQLIELPEVSLANLNGLTAESLPITAHSSKLDLSFYFLRTPDLGLQGSLVYATDLFSGERIQRLIAHLLTLLASTLKEPDASADRLPLLPDSEFGQIMAWQHGARVDVPDLCVHQLFEQQVECSPDAIALIFEDQTLSYRELNDRANQLAHQLADLGVGPEVIVALCLERSVELIVSMLAILKAGGAYLSLPTDQPIARLRSMLQSCDRPWLLFSDLHQELATSLEASSARSLSFSALKLNGFPRDNPPVRASSHDQAYVLTTSGSTGIPKLVAMDHAAIANRCWIYRDFWRLDSTSVVLAQSQFWYDNSLREWLLPLTAGSALALASEAQLSDPEQLLNLINQSRCTHLAATPARLSMLDLEGLGRPPVITAGGDRLPSKLWQRIQALKPQRFIHSFGATETCLACAFHDLAPCGDGDSPDGSALPIPIGRPLPNTSLLVLDPCGQPCPIGLPGELHIGGAGLARGYLNQPALTAQAFIPHPLANGSSERLYKSGDLASWNADGSLALHGRIDQQIKLRGFRIEPGEIEAALLAHPAVAQAVVILWEEDPANPRLIAYWVADPGAPGTASVTPEELRAFLSERLPAYLVPSAFVQLSALPLTANGKLHRQALPAPAFSGSQEGRVAPTTELERRLHAIWAEVLGHSEFGILDNFFLIGGHSLAAARLVAAMAQAFGDQVQLAGLFHSPTIADIVHLLGDRSSSRPFSLVTLQPQGDRRPLFVIHGWGGMVWGFINLARALSPHRPVYGLQAPGLDPAQVALASVRELAAGYADEILRQQPEGPIHLLGYSAGGWYAHAVAEALLQRGATVGVLALLDTHPSGLIHRRLGLPLVLGQLRERLPVHLRSLLVPKPTASRRLYLQQRLEGTRNLFSRYLHLKHRRSLRPAPVEQVAGAPDPPELPQPRGDVYVDLLYASHRPQRLPLRADLFAPASQRRRLCWFWTFYCTEGVVFHDLFTHHSDFLEAELTPQLAAALENALQRVEVQRLPGAPS